MECNQNENENEANSSSTNNSQNKINNINNNCINLESSLLNINLDNNASELKIISNISDVFIDICDNNSKEFIREKNQKQLMKPFVTINPSIKIKDYLKHLYEYGKMNTSTFILMVIYIDRLCNRNKIKLTYRIIHKLILSSLIVAVKYNEDLIYSSKFYAQCGGVSKTELTFLELCFITNIDFNLFVNEDLFKKYYEHFVDEDSFDDDFDEEEEEKEKKEKIPKG